jgi:hypothetical protein
MRDVFKRVVAFKLDIPHFLRPLDIYNAYLLIYIYK